MPAYGNYTCHSKCLNLMILVVAVLASSFCFAFHILLILASENDKDVMRNHKKHLSSMRNLVVLAKASFRPPPLSLLSSLAENDQTSAGDVIYSF